MTKCRETVVDKISKNLHVVNVIVIFFSPLIFKGDVKINSLSKAGLTSKR